MNRLLIYFVCAGLIAVALTCWLLVWENKGTEPVVFYLMLLAGFVGIAIGGSGLILLITWGKL